MPTWRSFVLMLTASDAARLGWRAVLAVLAIVIGYLALTPLPPPAADLGWDKLNHACAFAALAAAAWLSVRSPRQRARALLAVLAYGALIELAQTQVPGRSGEWGDLLADAVGIGVGVWLAAGLLDAAGGDVMRRVRSRVRPDSD